MILREFVRFPFFAASMVLAISCDGEKKTAPLPSRRDAVLTTAVTAGSQTSVPLQAPPVVAPLTKKEPLCLADLQKPAKKWPKTLMAAAFVDREWTKSNAWEPEKGSWHWVNLFASWCGPCKEEIPMLTRWETALRPKMNLTFLSLDDDERELRKFLMGGNGVRIARWHRSESDGSDFLLSLGLK